MSQSENPYSSPESAGRTPVPAWKTAIAVLLYLGAIPFGLLSALFIVAAIRWAMLSGLSPLIDGLLISGTFGAVAYGLYRLAKRLRS